MATKKSTIKNDDQLLRFIYDESNKAFKNLDSSTEALNNFNFTASEESLAELNQIVDFYSKKIKSNRRGLLIKALVQKTLPNSWANKFNLKLDGFFLEKSTYPKKLDWVVEKYKEATSALYANIQPLQDYVKQLDNEILALKEKNQVILDYKETNPSTEYEELIDNQVLNIQTTISALEQNREDIKSQVTGRISAIETMTIQFPLIKSLIVNSAVTGNGAAESITAQNVGTVVRELCSSLMRKNSDHTYEMVVSSVNTAHSSVVDVDTINYVSNSAKATKDYIEKSSKEAHKYRSEVLEKLERITTNQNQLSAQYNDKVVAIEQK